jgi:WD40 repeat protein
VDALGDPLPDGALARLGTTRFRAADGTLAACLSADGTLAAVAGPGKTVRILDATDGKEVKRLKIDHGAPTKMAFSPAGDLLATTWHDGGLRLWDLASEKLLGRVEFPQARVEEFAFSCDGKRLAVSPEPSDGKLVVRVYEVSGLKEVAAVESVHAALAHVALSPDGKTLATWGLVRGHRAGETADSEQIAQTVQLWSVDEGKEAGRLFTDRGWVTSAAFAPDGKTLAAATRTGAVQLWDPAAGKALKTMQGRGFKQQTLTFSPDGKTLYSRDEYGQFLAWEAESGRRRTLADSPGGRACGLAFTADGTALGCNLDGEALVPWEVAAGKTYGPKGGNHDVVAAVAFASDGQSIFSAGADGVLIEWDAQGRERARPAERIPAGDPRHIAPVRGGETLSPGAKYVVSGGDPDVGLRVRETATGREVFAFSVNTPPGGLLAAFSPDGAALAAAASPFPNERGRIHLWETDSGRELFTLPGVNAAVDGLAFAPDGKTLAALCRSEAPGGGLAFEVLLWEAAADKEPRSFTQFTVVARGGRRSLAFSPDGRLLAASYGAGSLTVWDLSTGKERWRAERADAHATAPVVFAPDGRTLAWATDTQTGDKAVIQVLEVFTGKMRREFAGHLGPVAALAFSPDGRALATGGADTTVLLWDAAGLQPAEPLKKQLPAKELDALWSDLASADPAAAGKAVSQLAAAPADAVPYLAKQVRPAEGKPLDDAALAKRIADLNADDFETREKAERELAVQGAAAGPALRKALAGDPPAETKQRAQRLLDKLASPDASGDALRLRRAVEALELAGTPDAVKHLEALAKGKAEADLTDDAKAALGRLKKRAEASP